jgi:hypothetical protein
LAAIQSMKHFMASTIRACRVSTWLLLTGICLNAPTLSEGSELKTIQIRVVSQIQNLPHDWSRAYQSPQDEFHHFTRALKKPLEALKGAYEFEFKRFPARIDPARHSLTIYLHEWNLSRSGIIRAHFSVRYDFGEKKGTLGSFSGQSVATISTIRSLRDESFDLAVQKAGTMMANKLSSLLDPSEGASDHGAGIQSKP